jgi:hypothetical protein
MPCFLTPPFFFKLFQVFYLLQLAKVQQMIPGLDSRIPPFYCINCLNNDDGQWLRIAGFLIRFFMLRSPQCSWDTKPIRFILSSEILYNLRRSSNTSEPLKLSNFCPASRRGFNSIRGQRWIYLLPSRRNLFNPFLSKLERPSCLIPLPVFQ